MAIAIRKFYQNMIMVKISTYMEGFKRFENLKVSQDGTVTAIKPGDATIEAKIQV